MLINHALNSSDWLKKHLNISVAQGGCDKTEVQYVYPEDNTILEVGEKYIWISE